MRPATQAALCQCRTTLALMLQTVAQGLAQGWPSPASAKLTSGEGPFRPSTSQLSWIVSLFDLGMMLGSLVSFAVFASAGRRLTLAVAPLAFAAWTLLTFFAASPGYLYAARLLAGVGMGVNFTFSSIYIGEVATPGGRSALILSMTLLAPLGQLLAFAAGPYVSFRAQALLPAPFLVLCLVCTCVWTRETPFYLAMLGKKERALRELRCLRRGVPEELVLFEATEMERSVREQREDATTWRQTFSPPGVKRAATVVLVFSAALALLGVDSVLSYTQEIFRESGTVLNKSVSSMLVIGVKSLTTLAAMYLIRRVGRRPQLAATALANAVAMVAMTGYFLAKEHLGADVRRVAWLPLASLMVFMAACGLGVIPVSHMLIGELLSQRAKKIVAPMATVVLSGTSFGMSKAFLPLGDSVGFCVPFGVFALTNVFIVLFTLLVVPETKGKTLMQVQDELSKRSRNKPTTICKEPVVLY